MMSGDVGNSSASLPVHLVNKAPKGQLDARKPGHLRNISQRRPDRPLTLPPVFAGGGFVARWSLVRKLGQSRWSLPEHMIHISWRCLFWSPSLHLTPPSISAAAWPGPGDSLVAYGWWRPRSPWGAVYGRCTSSP